MSVNITIKVESVNTLIDTYTIVQLERSTAPGGVYFNVDNQLLVEDQFYYETIDTTGLESSWYRYRFYHTVTTAATAYSNPFRPPQRTRTQIMAQAIEDYDAGYVVTLKAGSSGTSLLTDDYRVKDGKTTGIGKGGWIRVASGSFIGEISNISDINHTTGAFTVSPTLTGSPAAGDIIEWHWLATPTQWLQAINKGLERYQIVDRVPIPGDGTGENSLSYLSWLYNKNQVAGLWRTYTNNIPEEPWDWWNVRNENGLITLLTYPPIQSTDTVFMECLRYLDPIFTDTSVLHVQCKIELAAALAYDEVLRHLGRPGSVASNQDRTAWRQARMEHRFKLRLLWAKYGPKFRQQRLKGTTFPTAIPQPWSPR